jgi:hypothetical protein
MLAMPDPSNFVKPEQPRVVEPVDARPRLMPRRRHPFMDRPQPVNEYTTPADLPPTAEEVARRLNVTLEEIENHTAR